MSVTREQRFARERPCPICGGFDGAARGQGKRCFGFLSEDGAFAHCTREGHAGSLLPNPDSGTYAHRLAGRCDCGIAHDAVPARTPTPTTASRVLSDSDFADCPKPYPCDYTDASGNVGYRVARWPRKGAKSYSMHHPTVGGWANGRGDVPRVPYQLPEVLAAVGRGEPVHVVEGEKKVHALVTLGLVATCNDGGAGKFTREHAAWLRDAARVVVWADNDEPGECHARQVVQLLCDAGVPDVRSPALPGLNRGEGLDNWLSQRHAESAEVKRAALLSLVEGAEIAAASKRPRAAVIRLSDVRSEPIEWLWQGYIPRGTLTVLDGDPGLGKSTLMLDLASRLSRGDSMPDGSAGPSAAGTVLLSAEDDVARVIRPRLEAMGADLNRIAVPNLRDGDGVPRQPTLSADDLVKLEDAIREVGAQLVVVDPLTAFLSKDVDAHRDQDVRRVLFALQKLAERTGVAVVVVRHLNKSQSGNPLYRGGGSIGIIAAARSGLVLAAEPGDSTGFARVLASTKSNLAPTPPSLRLRLVTEPDSGLARVCWEGKSTHSAATLLAPSPTPEERTAVADAAEFLHELLANGAVPARDAEREATAAGHRTSTIRRARERLGIVVRKSGRPGEAGQHWTWELPEVAQGSVRIASKVLNGAGDAQLRRGEPSASTCEHAAVEDAHAGAEEQIGTGPTNSPSNTDGEHLRTHSAPNSVTVAHVGEGAHEPQLWAPSALCPKCGGALLNWSIGPVCTGCKRKLELDPSRHGHGAFDA